MWIEDDFLSMSYRKDYAYHCRTKVETKSETFCIELIDVQRHSNTVCGPPKRCTAFWTPMVPFPAQTGGCFEPVPPLSKKYSRSHVQAKCKFSHHFQRHCWSLMQEPRRTSISESVSLELMSASFEDFTCITIYCIRCWGYMQRWIDDSMNE